jgi:hypothetical protein
VPLPIALLFDAGNGALEVNRTLDPDVGNALGLPVEPDVVSAGELARLVSNGVVFDEFVGAEPDDNGRVIELAVPGGDIPVAGKAEPEILERIGAELVAVMEDVFPNGALNVILVEVALPGVPEALFVLFAKGKDDIADISGVVVLKPVEAPVVRCDTAGVC